MGKCVSDFTINKIPSKNPATVKPPSGSAINVVVLNDDKDKPNKPTVIMQPISGSKPNNKPNKTNNNNGDGGDIYSHDGVTNDPKDTNPGRDGDQEDECDKEEILEK